MADKRDLPGPHFDTTAAFNTFFELDGIMATKKPITIRVVKMNQPFSVLTLEGTLAGKPGDYLAEGVEGELYPINGAIFEKTYDGAENYRFDDN